MTFSSAVGSMFAQGANNATKVPSWHGYVYKSVSGMTDEDVAAGKYQLRFVKTNGDQYVFVWDGNADYSYAGFIENSSGALGTGAPVAGTSLAMDPDLLEALQSDSWMIGAQTYYDEQRTSDGEWN